MDGSCWAFGEVVLLLRSESERIKVMPSTSVSSLLKLPASERAELAMALWDSLTDAERDAELGLTPEQATELDRRWADHVEDPASAIPWSEVRRKLQGGR